MSKDKSNARRLHLPDEVNVEELLAELEAYRWRDKKTLILRRFGRRLDLDFSGREEKIKAYEEQKWVRLIDVSYIIDEVDNLMLKGCTFDEIVRAMKEHIAEQLAEEQENENI